MAGIFVRNGWRNALITIVLIFSFLPIQNTNTAYAQLFSYPATLQGCSLGSPFSVYTRPTCSEAILVQFQVEAEKSASCTPDIITEPQAVLCDVTFVYPTYTHNFTSNTYMHPLYTCDYGAGDNWNPPFDLGGVEGGAEPFTCKIGNNTGIEIIPVKNLGDQGYQSSCDSDNPYISNPVHAGTGNKYASESDYVSQSLTFTRFYNSQDPGLGIKWRNSYNRQLVFTQNETESAAFSERANGQVLFFLQDINGLWVGDDDSDMQLHEVIDGNNTTIGWQLHDAGDTIESYDATGNLLSITNRDGRTQTLAYDANNRLDTVTDDIGRALSFTYDDSSRITTLTDPAGSLYSYGYDTAGNLVSVTYPDGKIRTYHYNEAAYTSGEDLPFALTGITDENGIRYATYTYDTQGRAIITEHAGGADRHMLAYNADTTTITDPLGSVYTRQFQTILGVAKSIGQSQPAGSGCSAASSATTYDINGNVASRADFNGNKTCYTHDLNRNLEIARVEGFAAGSACPGDLVNYTPAAGSSERKILTDWHIDFRLPIKVTEANRETTMSYDTYSNVTQLSIRDTGSNETRTWNTSYTYHPTVPGVIVQRIEDGPRTDVSDTITIDYYAPDENCLGGHFGCRAQVSRVTNALGHVTQITRYNAHGQPEVLVDPNGLTTTLAYDNRQRLTSRVVGTETTTYQHDGVGQVTRITFPDNSFIAYAYDDAHRLTEISDSLSNTIRYTLDAAGNRTKEEIFDSGNALAQTRSQEFDALSRLWKMTGAQNQVTELAYDANGNLKQTIDPLQFTATRQFDALDRLIQANDPMGGQTLQQQDALDQITQVTDPKGIDTTYTTNALGDVLQDVSADRGTTTYTYDAAGNQITRTDARGVVQTKTYDALNRPVNQSYITVVGVPLTLPTTWTYDAGTNGIGQLTGMSDESGNTTYSYDLNGRLLSKTQVAKPLRTNLPPNTLSYSYDNSGRLSQTTYPSGAQIETIYGADGRPTELKVNGNTLIQNITYRPFGPVESWVWGNGQVHTRSFDLDGRLTQHLLGTDTQTLSYDAASQIINTTHTNPVHNRSYDYDGLGRLIRQSSNISTRQWTFDANSNRTSVQSGSTVYPYTLDASSNRLLSAAGPVAKTYTYDAAGNALTDGITDFTWNTAGRLSQVDRNNVTHTYKYNSHGERISKNLVSRPNTPEIFFYDVAGRLISEYNTSVVGRSLVMRLNKETVWLDDIPIAVLKQPVVTEPIEVYYVHADHINTPRLIVDSATNTPVWRWNNVQAFGDNLPDEDPDGDGNLFEYNVRFAGQYFDSETNLHYNYFRDYEPETGRYLSSDPIGLAGGLNTYGYALQNPLSFIDPTGEAPICVIFPAACAAAISAAVGAVIGASENLISQLFSNGGNLQCIDKSEVAQSAALSAIPFGTVGAIGSKVLGKFVTKKGGDLFRVVDDIELADIKKTNAFRTAPGQFEGKQFVDNLGDAKKLQKKFSDFFGGNQTIVKGKALQSVLNNASRTPFSDIPNGTAITVPRSNLPAIKPEL